jgi:trehalose 6-phosphate synthase
VLLGVDRLDYTKGIGHRLQAWAELLADGEVSPDEAVFVQVATPSRERVEAYQTLRDDIELQVGRINGDYGRIGQPAVHYLHSSYDRAELVALLRAADVMVVTPLRDGMNLVAKEYVAARTDLRGALVLSEFAGAADELDGAFLVNPHDIDGLKRTLCVAMRLPDAEAEERMRRLRDHVMAHDIARWAREFLETLRAT